MTVLVRGLSTRAELTRDPRPEFAADSLAWEALLRKAWDAFPDENPGHPLFGALHTARCHGGKLVMRQDGGLKIAPGPDPKPHAEVVKVLKDYTELVAQFLEPGVTEPAAQKAEKAARKRRYERRR